MKLRNPIARPHLSLKLSQLGSVLPWVSPQTRWHDSQESALPDDKHAKLATSNHTRPCCHANLRCFHMQAKFPDLAMNGNLSRGHACRSGACSTRHSVTAGLGNCALRSPLKTVVAITTPRRTQVFVGMFCSRITRQGLPLASARALTMHFVFRSPSLEYRSLTSVSRHEHTTSSLARKIARRDTRGRLYRFQKTCPKIQLSFPQDQERKGCLGCLGVRSSSGQQARVHQEV